MRQAVTRLNGKSRSAIGDGDTSSQNGTTSENERVNLASTKSSHFLPTPHLPTAAQGPSLNARRISRAQMIAVIGRDGYAAASSHWPGPSPVKLSQVVGPSPDRGQGAAREGVAVPVPDAPGFAHGQTGRQSQFSFLQPLPSKAGEKGIAGQADESQEFCIISSIPVAQADGGTRKIARKVGFDASVFDALIYQQPAASKPPPGVVLPRLPERKQSSSEDQRLYVHADPRIHTLHNRSERWHKAKAREIQARGGRKRWFGKAAERIRWVQCQKNEKERDLRLGRPGLRPEPKPWTYTRPLDFEDVPESDLPEDVLRNPDWLKACAFFRDARRAREQASDKAMEASEQDAPWVQQQRHKKTKKAEEVTEKFYRALVARTYGPKVYRSHAYGGT